MHNMTSLLIQYDRVWYIHAYTTEYFKLIPKAVFSCNDSQRKKKEEAAYIFFMDFIEECEGTTLCDHVYMLHFDLFDSLWFWRFDLAVKL